MRRILVTGGSGLFAVNFALRLRGAYEVVLALHTRKLAMAGVKAQVFDLGSAAAVEQMLHMVRPDLVVHTAAETSVERCEADPEAARRVNVQLPGDLAAACAAAGCSFVHISTDHLFDGRSPMNTEDASVAPLNAYGLTKAEGEAAVRAADPGALVIRTNFYGWGPPWRRSFSDGILASLRDGKPVGLFADVFYTPILIAPLIAGVIDLVEARQTGCFNVVGDDRLSKYDFGVLLARAFGLDEGLAIPTRIADMPHLAPRPGDMSLSNAKACAVLGRRIGGVREHLRMLHDEERTAMKAALDGLA